MKSYNTSGFDFILYATLISFAIARDISPEEQDLFGNFLQIIGQNLTSMAAYTNDIQDIKSNKSDDNLCI